MYTNFFTILNFFLVLFVDNQYILFNVINCLYSVMQVVLYIFDKQYAVEKKYYFIGSDIYLKTTKILLHNVYYT